MKPIIGITAECEFDPEDTRTRGNIKLNWNYAELVARFGGVPVIIPPTADPDEVASIIDGWLIPGGRDIDAKNWGEANHPNSELQDSSRFELEQKIFRQASADLPILGICYGCQAINVMRGGSLDQHLPETVGHETHTGGTLESYEVGGNTKLGKIVGTSCVEGKSYHHQGVGKVGEGLRVSAKHSDGTVEAIEATDRSWLVGVQWHPERTPDDEATIRLFKDFIEAAAAYRKKKLSGAR